VLNIKYDYSIKVKFLGWILITSFGRTAILGSHTSVLRGKCHHAYHLLSNASINIYVLSVEEIKQMSSFIQVTRTGLHCSFLPTFF
jgi:hypothetical protein